MTNRGHAINFLYYERLRYDTSKLFGVTKDCEMFGPYLPYILLKIGYNTKGCAKIYNLVMNFNNNIVKETQNKWEKSLNEEIPYHIVEKSFTQIQSMKEGSFTKYLQFKMLHRRIVTNKKLCYMGLTDTSKCPYCENLEETIDHAFLNCEKVIVFWKEVERWLRTEIDNSINISNIEEIMGTGTLECIVDKTILATKRVIYRNRQKGIPYTLIEVKALLKTQMLIEEN